MRLVTRADFDGLCCAVLLKELHLIESFRFVHPKDVQDGKVYVDQDDIIANLPYAAGCGYWFDHHSSETERLEYMTLFEDGLKGACEMLPSCARVIWKYFGGHDTFPKHMDEMMDAVDKMDSANLSIHEINNPKGWILLGFIVDPRTGLGRFKKFNMDTWELMENLSKYCRAMPVDFILTLPDLKERVETYKEQAGMFRQMIRDNAVVHGNVVVVDLRDVKPIYAGNRFAVYGLYPECNVSVQLMWDHRGRNVVFSVGYSVVNRTCAANVGQIMLSFGGGGHKAVGTCQIPAEKVDAALEEIIKRLHE
ncbi:MAG: exopolyphosphatase [Desulfovibrionaceae bacterium]